MPRLRPLLSLIASSILFCSIAAAVEIRVTTNADAGPGSLRQAILDANGGGCSHADPCVIRFPDGSTIDSPALRITLQSPLPPVTAHDVHVGGGTQGFWPQVTISGPGDGLRIEGTHNVSISAFVISGFPGYGVVIDRSTNVMLDTVRSTGNGRDGVVISDSQGVTMRACYVNDNDANGVYAVRAFGISIASTFIGTDENNAQHGNFAHGIHLHDTLASTVALSSLRYNGGNGFVISGQSTGNRFEYSTADNNGLLGIDIGNDGPTAARAPVITSASFNRGWVRVTGTVHGEPNETLQVLTYVSAQPDPSGFGEGASIVLQQEGVILVATDERGDGSFTAYFSEFTSGEPMRGRFVSAIAQWQAGTSEFSRSVRVTDNEPNFVVTTTADAGPGSLRDAIERANASAECVRGFPCGIVFHISESTPVGGAFTITPRTALPALTRASVWIDGATQRETSADANPAGPPIVINGALCAACNGLEIRSADPQALTLVRDVTINGFRDGDGIAAIGGADPLLLPVVRVDNCYVGTDSAGERAVPNRRGIYLENANAELGAVFDNRVGAAPGRGNLISGNAGDGISLANAFAVIERNLIGTDRTGLKPLGNLGAGIRSAGSMRAEGNAIAFNGNGGVIVTTPDRVNSVLSTTIYANRSLGIDVGGDGETENGTPGVEDAPVIISAVQTGNSTRVRYRAPLPPRVAVLNTIVTFYASSFTDASGRGEGRTIIGSDRIFSNDGTEEREIVIERALAGKYVTATATMFDAFLFLPVGTTSEFSDALQVTSGGCPSLTPQILAATNIEGRLAVRWSALPGATEYRVWIMGAGDEPRIAFLGSATEATVDIPPNAEWWVEARFDPCYGTQSQHGF